MEGGESPPVVSRKELRKKKLMEYLAAKGKLKPVVRPVLHDNCEGQQASVKVVMGKENNAPAVRFKYKDSKSQTFTAQSSQDPLRKRAFGICNTVNVKGSALSGKENAVSSSSTQSKSNQNPLLTKTYSVVSSKSSLTLKTQTNARSQTSGKAPSNAACTVGGKSNSKSSLSSNSVTSCPINIASSRISIGPLVKTKTGLTPAVTQPRNTKSNVLQPYATAHKTISTVVAKKVQSTTTSAVSWSQRPSVAASSNSRAGGQFQAQNKSKPKGPLDKHAQPTCKSQLSDRLRLTSTSFKCKAPTVKPDGRVLTSKSAGRPAGSSFKGTSEAGGEKKSQPVRAALQTSSWTKRSSSATGSRFNQAAATERGGKTKTNTDTLSKKDKSSTKILPPQAPTKCVVGSVVSQTAPQPSRSISFTGRATDMKTPKVTAKAVPQTEGKKVTAAQEERLKKLQEWREAKGISYKRPPMQVKAPVRRTMSVPQPFWASMKAEDEAHSLISAVDRSLADCIKLLAEGCPPDQVKEVLLRLPAVSHKFAKYWICQARLMEHEGKLDVLPMFEEAVRVVLEPIDELRTVVFDILKKKDEIQENENQGDCHPTAENTPDENDVLMTPKPVRALINGEREGSSVIKYKITKTPGGPPSLQRDPVRVHGQEVWFFTPVRRSVRIERASIRYPASLQDHEVCVTSYNELISEEDKERCEEPKSRDTSPAVNGTPMYIYRENEALGDKVSVRLICDQSF